MKTQDLVKTVANQTDIPEEQVDAVIRATLAAISDGRSPGEEVLIAGFGSFRISNDQEEIHSRSSQANSSPTREAAWESHFGPYLQAAEVQRRLRLTDIQQVARLTKAHRVLALQRDGSLAYPAFQFTEHGEIEPTISQVVMILSEVVETPYSIASWLTSPKDALEGETPLRWLERGMNSDVVIDAAKLTAARLAS